jgi:hypothetical protein
VSDALRELIASFYVEVDKAGELAKGSAEVDALKAKLAELQAGFAKVKAPAEQAGKAIGDALGKGRDSRGRFLPGGGSSVPAPSPFGGGRADNTGFGDAFAAAAGRTQQFGPTRETMVQGRAQMAAAEQAAAAYAKTLRGRLAGAVNAVRAGFNGGGGGGKGPGLIASLATVRNGFLALGAGVAVHAVKGLVDGIGDISEGAARLGVTTDEFQRLRVLARLNATDVGTLGAAFRTLANSAVEPTKETAAAFAKLGVSTRDASGQFKSSQDLFFDVGEALAGVANETERSQLAQKLLGRSAQQLKPIFAQGTEAFQKQRLELLKLNVLGKDTVDAADSASDSWVILGAQLLAASEPLLKLLIPGLVKLTEWVTKAVDVGGKWLKQTDLVAVAMTALGGYMALKFLPGLRLLVGLGGRASKVLLGMAGSAGKMAWNFAKVAGPLLLLEDFLVWLRGGKSVFGAGLDTLFGEGASKGVRKALADLVLAFQDLWKWILGDGAGEKAKALYNEIAKGLELMVHDLLVKAGLRSGKAGLAGLDEFNSRPAEPSLFQPSSFMAGPGGLLGQPSISIPAPGGTTRQGQAGTTTIVNNNGDTSLTFHAMKREDAQPIADKVTPILERKREATVAPYQ